MQIVFKNVWAFDTCSRAVALTLRERFPSLLPTPNNTRKERQSSQEIVSLPPTSPDDSLRFFGASWAFCAKVLFYIREWRDHDDDDEFNKEWRWVMNERMSGGILFAIFTSRIMRKMRKEIMGDYKLLIWMKLLCCKANAKFTGLAPESLHSLVLLFLKRIQIRILIQ